MRYSNVEIGTYIQERRNQIGFTQQELGERLLVSSQAVSKWERGESLPDVSLLVDLSGLLHTSVDLILTAGNGGVVGRGMIDLVKIKRAVNYLSELEELIGSDNTLFESVMKGVRTTMNVDFRSALKDNYKREAFVVEVAIQKLMNGHGLDEKHVDHVLEFEHWKSVLHKSLKQYRI
ncbi:MULTISPECIES: helix-turn-helix domain-containing protein [unclassified Fusibacter]|uniref:helix-turn-helix domain-containing protein n=1 Tax=unclassified Fusibacter TaxID=2624464 RepID=UPI0010120F31|nr:MULTISPECIES: helix-turn-helix transcriptional regulator [unclassified Fusibacter]MCK8059315.1 helix-turn-helix transcriptional regulator [Fusibacter sp. A2]NPE21221.1 helix-turn-helix transcriptional regulator [Fusibacter sp. A1]RXV62489.1 XRE family transcriptional regulator [Fusibacter sp. A1]